MSSDSFISSEEPIYLLLNRKRAAVDGIGTGEIAFFQELRRDFPAVTYREGQVYFLDNAAMTQKPYPVIERMEHLYREGIANVYRALYPLAEEVTALYETSRRRIQAFLGAASPREIIFTSGTTSAINGVAIMWGRDELKKGDRILLSGLEHDSNSVPWDEVAKATGATVTSLPIDPSSGAMTCENLKKTWSDRVKMVAISHQSHLANVENDISSLAAFVHERGAHLLVDGAQSVAHRKIDVQKMGCDFFVFSGHKVYGPDGVGVLYGREALLESHHPWYGGGGMVAREGKIPRWGRLPHIFEAGTPPVAGAIGLGEAITYLVSIGWERIARYETHLREYAKDRLGHLAGVSLYTLQGEGKGGIILLNCQGIHPHDLAFLLGQRGIAVRAGSLCSRSLVTLWGVATAVRVSLCFYNTTREIDFLVTALEEIQKQCRRGNVSKT